MHRNLNLPTFVTGLVAALQAALPNAEVEAEPVGSTNTYRLAVVSTRFNRMDHPRRQNLVWDVVEKTLSPEEMLRISMILTLRPEEAESLNPS